MVKRIVVSSSHDVITWGVRSRSVTCLLLIFAAQSFVSHDPLWLVHWVLSFTADAEFLHFFSLVLVCWRHNRHNLSLVLSHTRDPGNEEFRLMSWRAPQKMVPKGPPQHLNDRLLGWSLPVWKILMVSPTGPTGSDKWTLFALCG